MASGWSAYVNNLMESSSHIQKCAIIGATDGSVWAKEAFSATDDELKKFAALFDKLNEVPSTGFDLEGVHYICPRTEDNLIFGKFQNTGIFAVKTKLAVVIACYEGGRSEGQESRTAVERMGQYLQQSGY